MYNLDLLTAFFYHKDKWSFRLLSIETPCTRERSLFEVSNTNGFFYVCVLFFPIYGLM